MCHKYSIKIRLIKWKCYTHKKLVYGKMKCLKKKVRHQYLMKRRRILHFFFWFMTLIMTLRNFYLLITRIYFDVFCQIIYGWALFSLVKVLFLEFNCSVHEDSLKFLEIPLSSQKSIKISSNSFKETWIQ